jgi:hypothetical protein
MKKILLLLLIVATSVFADYVTFQTRNIDLSQVKERKVIFFGGYRDYKKSLEEIQSNFAVRGALGVTQGLSTTNEALAKGLYSQALNGAAAGFGIGLAVEGIGYVLAENAAERQFIKLEELTMNDGTKKIFYKMLVTNKAKDFTLDEAKNILQ